jgi:hypothetical protein
MEAPALHPGSKALGATAVVLAVSVVAFGWLLATCDPPRVHLDTSRDLLMANDCLRGECPSWGTVASTLGLRQGTLWIRVLAWGQAAGLDASGLQRLLVALQALGAGALAWGALRLGAQPWRAATLTVVYVALLRTIESGDLLWNPIVAHPGAAVFAVGWLGLAAGGGLGFALLAGLGAALAILGHVLGLVLLPLLAFGLTLGRAHPLAALAAASGVLAGGVLLDSYDAVLVNARAFSNAGLAAPMAGAVIAAFLVGLPLRRRWLATSVGWRATFALGLALALAGLAPALIPRYMGVAEGGRFAYLLPPFAALAVGLWADALLEKLRLPRLAGGLLTLLAVAAVLGHAGQAWRSEDHGGPRAVWRLPEVERLAADLYGRGATYAELFRRVQGPWDTDLVSTFAALDPTPAPVDDDRGPLHGLLILRVARSAVPSELPDGWRALDVSPGYVALLRESTGGLGSKGLEVTWSAPGEAPRTAVFERRWKEATDRPRFFVDRFYPHAAPDAVCHDGGASPARWTLPLEPAGGPRQARLLDAGWAGCAWTLLSTTGEPAPGGVLALAADQSAVHAAVEPKSSWCRTCCSPPPLLVAPADDPVVAAWLRDPAMIE